VGRGEKGVYPSLSIGHQTLEPFKGHQALEPPIGTELGSSFTSVFFLFFKEQIRIIWGFLSRHNFQFESWEYLFLKPSLGREEWLVLVGGGKKENRLDDYSTFERMEMNRDSVGSLKS